MSCKASLRWTHARTHTDRYGTPTCFWKLQMKSVMYMMEAKPNHMKQAWVYCGSMMGPTTATMKFPTANAHSAEQQRVMQLPTQPESHCRTNYIQAYLATTQPAADM